MQEWYLGWERVSCLETCPHFRGLEYSVHLSLCMHMYIHFVQAFVWGLNDRGQLGSEVSEAKVKVPIESPALAKLRPIQFVGGAKTLFIISQDGKVNID